METSKKQEFDLAHWSFVLSVVSVVVTLISTLL